MKNLKNISKSKSIIIAVLSVLMLFILIGTLFVGKTDNRIIFTLKNIIPNALSSFIKETILFPFTHKSRINILNEEDIKMELRISHLENQTQMLRKTIFDLSSINNDFELLSKIEDRKKIISTNKNKFYLSKFYFNSMPWQNNGRKPSGYLTQHQEKVFTLTGQGEIGFFDIADLNSDFLKHKNIKTNLYELISSDSQIKLKGKFGFRGIMINNTDIFVSYQKHTGNDCYNVSILKSKLKADNLMFQSFFTYDECSNIMTNHTGAKMIKFNDESFLFTIGDGQQFAEAQNDNSMFGKILKINYLDSSYEMIAKGMRDTQGGHYYEKDKILILSEHGPSGGDEINAIKLSEFNNDINFGWPVATYGKIDYIVMPENKFTVKDKLNHSKNGFKEPLHWFKGKSVAPSNIINIDGFTNNINSDFVLSAMGNVPYPGRRSLHHLRFDKDYSKLIYSDIIPVGERVRDIIFIKKQNKILMLLENSPSIAVLESK